MRRAVAPSGGTPLSGIVETKMAGVTGLEPATSGVTGRHSNRLSYTPAVSRPGRTPSAMALV